MGKRSKSESSIQAVCSDSLIILHIVKNDCLLRQSLVEPENSEPRKEPSKRTRAASGARDRRNLNAPSSCRTGLTSHGKKRKRRQDPDRIGRRLKSPYAAATATKMGRSASKPACNESVVKDNDKESIGSTVRKAVGEIRQTFCDDAQAKSLGSTEKAE